MNLMIHDMSNTFESLALVYQAITSTDRTSCMVENLNSRLRPYLTLRKQM